MAATSKSKSSSGKAQSARKPRSAAQRWPAHVTKHSHALDLKHGVFTWKDPRRIAASLKTSAEHSRRRKADPYRSALSMLTFTVNRAGKNLSAAQKKVLVRSKAELRKAFRNDA